MLRLFTDTDCDVTLESAKEMGYELISMPYTLDDVEYFPCFSKNELDHHSFYERLRQGATPTTSAVNPFQYREYFEPFFKNGDDILYVHFSEKMSGTFNAMNIAVKELLEEYPERKFYEIDTKAISVLSYLLCYEISKLYKEGKTVEEIMAWANENINKYAMYFYADDLDFFKRSGRVSGFAAFFGGLIGIKPIIYMSEDGEMKVLEKEKGKRKALMRLIEHVKELGDDVQSHRIAVATCDAMEEANNLIDLLKENFGDKLDIVIIPISPTIGCHCGPSTVGLAFHAKKRV